MNRAGLFFRIVADIERCNCSKAVDIVEEIINDITGELKCADVLANMALLKRVQLIANQYTEAE